MLFLDPSHYFTYIINYKTFLINEYRFGCALPSLFPSVALIWACLWFPWLWLFTIADRNLRPYNFREAMVLSTLLIAICAGKFWLMRHGWYDSGKTEWVKTATVKSAGMLFRNPVILYFFRQAFSTHLFSGLIFIAGLAGAIRRGKWLSLILTLVFAAAYLFSVSMTFDSVIPFTQTASCCH